MFNNDEIKELKKEFFGNDNHLIITPISEILGEDLRFDYDKTAYDYFKFISLDDEILKLDSNLIEENEFENYFMANYSNTDNLDENIINKHLDFIENNIPNIKILREFYQNELREIDLDN